MIKYRKDQYERVRGMIHSWDLNDISKETGIPVGKLFGILKSLKIRLTDREANDFIVRNGNILIPKQLSTLTNISPKEVHQVLHENGMRLDHVYVQRRPWNRKELDLAIRGIFNVHERENWLV